MTHSSLSTMAAAPHCFKQRFDNDLQQHASIAHKVVSDMSASQAVDPPCIALEHFDSQVNEWQHIRQSNLSSVPCLAIEESQLAASHIGRLSRNPLLLELGCPALFGLAMPTLPRKLGVLISSVLMFCSASQIICGFSWWLGSADVSGEGCGQRPL